MIIIEMLKKKKLLGTISFIYFLLFLFFPQKAIASFQNSLYYLKELLLILPIIFILTVIIETWIPKEVIMKGLGDTSGFSGHLFSLMLGSFSAGPIYAAFPIGKMLLSKGASIINIVIILSTWAVVKVPMLINEAKFFDLSFMAVRWALTVIAILIMGYLVSILVKREDIIGQDTHKKPEMFFTIKEEYCIGCGLCVKISPEYYEMEKSKALIKKIPDTKEASQSLQESVNGCPAKAIELSFPKIPGRVL